MALHANGPEKAPELVAEVRSAKAYLGAIVISIVEDTCDAETMDTLRSSLHDVHPDIPYERPLTIARDLIDIAVTLDGLTEFSGDNITGENFTAVRKDPTKISDAMLFFKRLSEIGA